MTIASFSLVHLDYFMTWPLLLSVQRDVGKILQIILGIDTTDDIEAVACAILTCGMGKSFWYVIAMNGGGVQVDPAFTRQIKA